MSKDEEFLKRLLATFNVEAAEHLEEMARGLIELEQVAAAQERARVVERIFREAHSLKGAARSVGLTAVEGLCQAMESVVAALKRQEIEAGVEVVNLLHLAVNLLGELLAGVEDRERLGNLIGRLHGAAQVPLPPAGLETAPAAEPPAAQPAAGTLDAMRVSRDRLYALLLEGEAFLAMKQAAGQRAAELRALAGVAARIRRQAARLPAEIRALPRGRTRQMAGPSSADQGNPVFDILADHEDQVAKFAHDLAVLSKAADRDWRTLAAMVDGFLEDLKTMYMLPFSTFLALLPKIVRDLAHDQGKEVRFVAASGEIEIDKRILDELREPLIHLVRNCLDHGIEKPAERVGLGKPRTATVRVEVAHRDAKTVEVTIIDDGRGIDRQAVREAAVKSGSLARVEAEALDEQQALQLVFLSGVTTSPIITDLSGRGLGLAIVRERVEKLGGTVVCESAPGHGTAFRLRLPLTLATFRGVLVRAGEHWFVLPALGLNRMVRVKRDEIRTIENRETIEVDGRAMSFVRLRAVLELPGRPGKGEESEYLHAAVCGPAGQRIAFGVDEVAGEQEVLVKDLGRQLRRVRNVAGATVLGSGQVVPILHTADLLRSAVKASVAGAVAPGGEGPAARKQLLVVEDSITSRALLKNVLEASGYEVRTAVDGIDAITLLKSSEIDLVVSDVDMPRMNGFELTARIRADKKLAELPVVLVTALESREDRERGIEVGANAYIVKSSFDKSNLLEAVERLL